MFLSRVTLSPPDPRAFLSLIGARMKAEDPSFAHKMIWTLFAEDPSATRDFLFEVTGRRPFQALVRSRREPVDGLGCWHIETIPFRPRLAEGQRLRFSLDAVAVRSVKAASGDRRGKPLDVVMAEWRNLPEHRRAHLTPDDLADPVGREWLEAQGTKHGFNLEDDTTVLAYERHRFPNKGRRHVTVGSLKFSGSLTVTDVPAFEAMLGNGLGRQRAFGFGMMQIAPGGRGVTEKLSD
ncbi:type I-E CRISPR-associated protein Cas6/Cse3/CasE [Caenispirillum salinarum]|uniref:type I-E CRISPR-associated protein Cas6/Cse3/CasE n=1 Tax=Caenispirillum salinarum TaxID=859058 RepID=UPI003850584E